MIYYFSGEGNTRYACKRIARIINENYRFITAVKPDEELFEGKSLGFMFPIYSWGVPPVMLSFIKNLSQSFIDECKSREIPVWMVCTCGDDTGKACEMLEKSLIDRGLTLNGAWSVIMPNTYVLLPGFNVDSPKVENKKLEEAPLRIDRIANNIREHNWERDMNEGSLPRFKTKYIYPGFMKWGINPQKWRWTQECIQCGKCANVCPVNNIEIRAGHPRWYSKCISCLACYHYCPVHAVAYGNRTEHKGQYTCHL